MKTIERNGVTISFDDDLALRWIVALESGMYKQGKEQLRKRNRFCCLGVLCDITDSSKWDNDHYGENSTYLPVSLSEQVALKWTGDRLDDRDFEIGGTEGTLAKVNDSGATFRGIAAALRDYYGFEPRQESAVAS